MTTARIASGLALVCGMLLSRQASAVEITLTYAGGITWYVGAPVTVYPDNKLGTATYLGQQVSAAAFVKPVVTTDGEFPYAPTGQNATPLPPQVKVNGNTFSRGTSAEWSIGAAAAFDTSSLWFDPCLHSSDCILFGAESGYPDGHVDITLSQPTVRAGIALAGFSEVTFLDAHNNPLGTVLSSGNQTDTLAAWQSLDDPITSLHIDEYDVAAEALGFSVPLEPYFAAFDDLTVDNVPLQSSAPEPSSATLVLSGLASGTFATAHMRRRLRSQALLPFRSTDS